MAEARNIAGVPEQACGQAVAHAIHTWTPFFSNTMRLCLGAPAEGGDHG